MPLILASRSPQRRAILESLGVEFEVRPTEVEELTEGDPLQVATENARRKSLAAEGDLVLGVDTVVALRGTLYGKPLDEVQARATLQALSSETHSVVSAVALRSDGGEPRCATAVTAVTFRWLDSAAIEWYAQSGEWRERAGAYAIQGRGAALVERIEGEYLNIVGLPLTALLELWPGLLVGTPPTP